MPVKTSENWLSGKDVKIFRISRRLTHDTLAEWLGVTPQAVFNYERRGMTRQQALALAAIDRGLKPWRPTDVDMDDVEKMGEI